MLPPPICAILLLVEIGSRYAVEQLLDSAMDVLGAVDDISSHDDLHGEHIRHDARGDDTPCQHQNRIDVAALGLWPQSQGSPRYLRRRSP